MLEVLRLPDERVDDALALAHEVRMRWCGPEVEVEGIVSLKTGGCPEDCHFCSQSGRFETPVRAARLDIPSLVEAARQTAQTGRDRVLHRRRRARPRRAADGAGARRHRGDPRRGRHQHRLLARHPHAGAGRRARGDGRPPLQPQPRGGALALPAGRDHAHVGGALGDAASSCASAAWRSAAAASSAWARRSSSAPSSPRSSPTLRARRGADELPRPAARHAVRRPAGGRGRRRAARRSPRSGWRCRGRSCASPAGAS